MSIKPFLWEIGREAGGKTPQQMQQWVDKFENEFIMNTADLKQHPNLDQLFEDMNLPAVLR